MKKWYFDYAECPALYDNKIKHSISSTMKFIGEINAFSNTVPDTVPYSLSRSQCGHH
jgi:hypothetical protein